MQPHPDASGTVHADIRDLDRSALGFFRRSTIRARLTIAFLLLAGAMALLGTVGVWQLEVLANAALSNSGADAIRDAARSGQIVVAAICGTVFVLAFVFCYPLTVHVVKPVRVAARLAGRVAAGDLTVRVRTGGSDEAAQLMKALAEMTSNLRSVLGSVVEGAHAVAETSGRMVVGNQDLSQRTEEQASTLEETASSMEQLTSTVAQNADNAREASKLALDASAVARRGGEAVDQVVNTMDEISDASRKITEIISVIDGIAFQTNILALNAAVEAARAGEQGRGFAVVAAEVRSLAQRSAEAAKEIKTLISASVEKVNLGSSLVDTAGHTMVEVVLSVEKVSALIAEIAQASQEQSAGIGPVNTAIAQMERVVERNASLVEQATDATGAMNAQAETLLQIARGFRLEGDASPARVPSAAGKTGATGSAVKRAPKLEPLQPIRFRPNAGSAATSERNAANSPSRPGEWTAF
jgi:methyl-accepting chemotaxis protein